MGKVCSFTATRYVNHVSLATFDHISPVRPSNPEPNFQRVTE